MNNEKTPGITKYRVISILQTFFCCTPMMITGAIALFCTFLADAAYKRGDIKDYKSKIKSIKILTFLGWLILLAGLIGAISMHASFGK